MLKNNSLEQAKQGETRNISNYESMHIIAFVLSSLEWFYYGKAYSKKYWPKQKKKHLIRLNIVPVQHGKSNRAAELRKSQYRELLLCLHPPLYNMHAYFWLFPNWSNKMRILLPLTLILVLISLQVVFSVTQLSSRVANGTHHVFRVGVVLDMGSLAGRIGMSCLSMALSDFYSFHTNFTTRLVFYVKDSKGNVIDAAASGILHSKN